MLEDDFTYVMRKALKGLALSPSQAATLAGLPEPEVLAFSRGRFSAEIARQIAPVLGLDAVALGSHDKYLPAPLDLPEIKRLELPFGEDHVNAWLISSAGIQVLFDTGDDPISCPEQLANLGVEKLDAIFITHDHRDHVAALDSLTGKSDATFSASGIGKTAIFPAGKSWELGPISIQAVDLSGHANPSNGYLVSGLSKPVLVSGDAMFAGSMGGCPDSATYQHALERLKSELAELPAETVILPGHGPATTLTEEWDHNPFPIR